MTCYVCINSCLSSELMTIHCMLMIILHLSGTHLCYILIEVLWHC